MANDGTVKIGAELDESKLKKGISGVGNLAKKGIAAAAGVTAAGITAFGAMAKASLDAVASMEQNIGGVETLFKDSADIVIENANRAYETAGMSANDYMSTVTSFSASLLQSLSGDTEAAAKTADMAIGDMSDNANKMGTSMEAIQNAYQGFAKQNYTMLDNLKLGYGGTKTEMERLLKDAEELSGIEYDIDNLNDVYSALHVIQEEMGITGTTAKEAASTIEGSMNSAKAAWDNFLAGSGTAEELVASFSTAAGVVFENLSEIIPRLAETVPEAAGMIATNIGEQLPQFVDFGMQLIKNLADGITNAGPSLIENGLGIVETVCSGIMLHAPTLIQSGMDIITNIVSGLVTNAPQAVGQISSVLSDITITLINALPGFAQSGADIITNLVNGLAAQAPNAVAQAGTMLTDYTNAILGALPDILSAGADMILSLLDGLVETAPDVIVQAGEMLIDFAAEIGSHLPEILQKGIEIIGKLLAGIVQEVPNLLAEIPGIISDIGSRFLEKDWGSIGKNIIDGIKNGISSAASGLVDSAVQAAKDAINTVKGWLGIASPSKRAKKEVGRMIPAGAAEGVEEGTPEFVEASEDSAQSAIAAMQKASAAEFVSEMQGKSYDAAEDNEMAARSKWQNNGYDQEDPDDDGTIVIYNHFDVDGTPLVDKTVKKTKREIAKEQKSKRAVKGDVAFA